ncbi:MAG: class I SAM-dependent methyltransferase [Chitinophagaceae bacterium]
MSVQQAYNQWASQYDTNLNKTRDLEAQVLRAVLSAISFDSCLEIGCGTGKNTAWLMQQAGRVTAVDFSEEMLSLARTKTDAGHVTFRQADIKQPWAFRNDRYDLVSFSLVLEHIENLDPVFAEAAAALHPGGHVYIGELHPFKQYTGSKARFDTEAGQQVVECFNHHVSDFIQAAKKHGLQPVGLTEHFDDGDRTTLPRILAILFQKPGGINPRL